MDGSCSQSQSLSPLRFHHGIGRDDQTNARAGVSVASLPKGRGASNVYAFRAYNGLIKFGYASNLRTRLSAIQSASPDPIVCVAFTLGALMEERRIHSALESARHHGEWFSPTPDVLAAVANFAEFVGALARSEELHNEAMRAEKARRCRALDAWTAANRAASRAARASNRSEATP